MGLMHKLALTLVTTCIVFVLSGCGASSTAPSPLPFKRESIDVLYSSVLPVAGFQFGVSGISVTGVRDGAAEAAGFTISTANNIVIGFSLVGATIATGEAVLVILDVTGSGGACLTDLVVSDSSGNAMDASVEDCLTILIHA